MMDSLQGHLLIAAPTMRDANFSCSVVLVVRHGSSGAMGLVLNRPSETTVELAWGQVSELPCVVDQPLYFGGPCEGPMMVLHCEAEAGEQEVSSGLWFSAEREQIEWLVGVEWVNARYFVGYAGWSPGQLEEEVEAGGWLTVPAAEVELMGDPQALWPRLIRMTTGISNLTPGIVPPDPEWN